MPGASNNYGIIATGQKNVLVRGPGTISGFGQGIFLGSGTGLSVTGVTITGPSVPKSQDLPPNVVNKRPVTSGIAIGDVHCALSFFAPSFSAVIQYNDISNQTTGITIDAVNCAVFSSNYVHDNSSGTADSHGVVLFNSSYNFVTGNIVVRNGTNQNAVGYPDSGIAVHVDTLGVNPGSTGNQIAGNDVSNNCGDGIELGNGSKPGGNLVAATNVSTNFVMNNSTSTLAGQCRAVVAGTFFDMANRNAGANTWNTNNACKTKLGVPAGVCP